MHTVTIIQALLLVASSVSAQTFTDCNPLKTTCPANPALSGRFEHNFGSGPASEFKVLAGSDVIKYGVDGAAAFRVEKPKDAPTIVSNFYIMFGKVEIEMKAAPGAGVVSSIVLQSDDLDEIDWEWVGSKPEEAQTNYFGKGDPAGYDRGATHPVSSQSAYHTYGIEWTKDGLEWSIDGKVVRSLSSTEKPEHYPQTPSQLRLGSWAAGDAGNEKGTIEWAGGLIDYKKGPHDMLVKRVLVQDYSSGKEYVYTDRTGSWQSIKAVDGEVSAGPQQGKGNAGTIAVTTGGSSFNAPTNSGLISSTTKSEPTSASGSVKATNTPESTRNSTSSDCSSSAHVTGTKVEIKPTGVNLIATGSSGFATIPRPTNGTAPTSPVSPPAPAGTTNLPGAAANVVLPMGIMVGAAGLVIGWLL